MPNDDTIFLKTKVDVLSFFNEEQLRRVTPDIERHTYAKGDFVLLKGEVTNSFYIIKKGRVAVLMKPKEGASVKAMEDDAEILMIPHTSFQKLLEMQPLLKKTLLDKAQARKSQ